MRIRRGRRAPSKQNATKRKNEVKMERKEREGKSKINRRSCVGKSRLTDTRYLDHTCVTQQRKHQLAINALNTEHEVMDGYVLISS